MNWLTEHIYSYLYLIVAMKNYNKMRHQFGLDGQQGRIQDD